MIQCNYLGDGFKYFFVFTLTSGNDVILGLVQPPTMLYKAGTLGKMIIFPKSPQTCDINVRSVPRVPGSRVIMFESIRLGRWLTEEGSDPKFGCPVWFWKFFSQQIFEGVRRRSWENFPLKGHQQKSLTYMAND